MSSKNLTFYFHEPDGYTVKLGDQVLVDNSSDMVYMISSMVEKLGYTIEILFEAEGDTLEGGVK